MVTAWRECRNFTPAGRRLQSNLCSLTCEFEGRTSLVAMWR
jgi:hypothetical protein